MDKQDLKNLKRRYLIWFYKTSKESLDKIERKFTQIEIDNFILKEIKKQDKDKRLKIFIDDFQAYIQKKKQDGLSLKYKGKQLKSDYLFLRLKLEAVEKAIIKELGKRVLSEIKLLYETETTGRILKSTEH